MKDHQKEWIKAAAIRAIKTFFQTFIATVGMTVATGDVMVLSDVAWMTVFSASALAGILSIATSVVGGMPEVEERIKHE